MWFYVSDCFHSLRFAVLSVPFACQSFPAKSIPSHYDEPEALCYSSFLLNYKELVNACATALRVFDVPASNQDPVIDCEYALDRKYASPKMQVRSVRLACCTANYCHASRIAHSSPASVRVLSAVSSRCADPDETPAARPRSRTLVVYSQGLDKDSARVTFLQARCAHGVRRTRERGCSSPSAMLGQHTEESPYRWPKMARGRGTAIRMQRGCPLGLVVRVYKLRRFPSRRPFRHLSPPWTQYC